MHGYEQGEHFMKNSVDLYDTWIIQKHWLHLNTLVEFTGLSVDYHYKAILNMNDWHILNCGRPKGGLAIPWRNEFKSIITYIGNSPYGRILAITLFGNDKNLCILNVYLPCYNGSIEY